MLSTIVLGGDRIFMENFNVIDLPDGRSALVNKDNGQILDIEEERCAEIEYGRIQK